MGNEHSAGDSRWGRTTEGNWVGVGQKPTTPPCLHAKSGEAWRGALGIPLSSFLFLHFSCSYRDRSRVTTISSLSHLQPPHWPTSLGQFLICLVPFWKLSQMLHQYGIPKQSLEMKVASEENISRIVKGFGWHRCEGACGPRAECSPS